MKTRSIVGVVVGLHLAVVGFVILVPGCGRSTRVSAREPAMLLPPRKVEMAPVRARRRVPEKAAVQETGPERKYVVKKGDVLSRIARNHGVSVSDILALNGLPNPDVLHVDQTILLPASSGVRPAAATPRRRQRKKSVPEGSELYKVQRGDCLSKIAVRHGMTVKELRDINELTTDMIRIGQKMIVKKRLSNEGASGLAGLLDEPDDDSVVDAVPDLRSVDDSAEAAPAGFYTHEVREGETLEKVAQLYLVSESRLMSVNKLSSPKIAAGMTLKIPQSD